MPKFNDEVTFHYGQYKTLVIGTVRGVYKDFLEEEWLIIITPDGGRGLVHLRPARLFKNKEDNPQKPLVASLK